MKFSKFTSLVLILFIIFSSNSFSQTSSRFSKERFVQDNDTLLYRLLYPDNAPAKKYPLVIFLHGAGERGNDNEAQLKWGVNTFASDEQMKLHPAIVIAPQCPEKSSWSNFSGYNKSEMKLQPTASKPMELVLALIQQVIKTLPVDTNRIYITGLSMGGFGTFDAISRYPSLFAAAVPVCGGGDESKASLIKGIPMWIIHGAQDPTVTPDYSIAMAAAIKKAGGNPGLTLYPDTGHFSWIPAYSDPMVIEWMFDQHK